MSATFLEDGKLGEFFRLQDSLFHIQAKKTLDIKKDLSNKNIQINNVLVEIFVDFFNYYSSENYLKMLNLVKENLPDFSDTFESFQQFQKSYLDLFFKYIMNGGDNVS